MKGDATFLGNFYFYSYFNFFLNRGIFFDSLQPDVGDRRAGPVSDVLSPGHVRAAGEEEEAKELLQEHVRRGQSQVRHFYHSSWNFHVQ